jgi:hypothetical protein
MPLKIPVLVDSAPLATEPLAEIRI